MVQTDLQELEEKQGRAGGRLILGGCLILLDRYSELFDFFVEGVAIYTEKFCGGGFDII